MLRKGQTKPWVYGTMQLNRHKNRFTNLPAYDHTRVKLNIINEDPHSDYINANYIDGYKSKKTYIATQGPKSCTVNDFWRMIWQEKVKYIVMLANIYENGKKKVEKYWPEIKCSKKFGTIAVEYVEHDVMPCYEVRYFNVFCTGRKRQIQQFHFLNWPDDGVPLYLQSLVLFCKKFISVPRSMSPIVVHSSVGVGRTGSFILCDICLHMAKEEGIIDVFRYSRKLRDQRVNMVENVEQYKLVHLLLVQCMYARNTGIPCNELMVEKVKIVMTDQILDEMKYLDDSIWQDEALRSRNLKSNFPIHTDKKDRFKDIVPDAESRVILAPYPPTDKSSMYINAVTVDAYFMSSKFIVTQNPMSTSVPEFWRMVEEKQIATILCLNELDFNDQSTIIFYPATDTHVVEPLPYLEIRCNYIENNENYTVYNLAMTKLDDQEEDVPIKLLQFKDWNYDMLHPKTSKSLLEMYEEINRLGKSSDKVLITCYDGARASGLFVSLCFVIDKIKTEQVCDVCSAVRTIRQSRQEFVRQEEQFSFLYKCALEYICQFNNYSNFVSKNSIN